jgi:UDP-glucose 4-epimerase
MDNSVQRTALVTGAAGFLGRHLCRELASQGWFVVGMGHGEYDSGEAKAWGISDWIRADITVENLLRSPVRPIAIFHCAGSGSVAASMQNPLFDFRRTVETTASVLDFARQLGNGCRTVLPSSAGVYGRVSSLPIAEDSVLTPMSPYGFHKMLAEQLCQSYGIYFGLPSARVRLFSVYGRCQKKLLLWDAYQKIASGNVTFAGTGSESRDWLHVDDAVRLLAVAANHADSSSPVVNGGTGVDTPVREILNEFFECLGSTSAPAFNGESRSGDPMHFRASTARANAWGWFPATRWQDGVRDYAEWLKAEVTCSR